MKKQISLPKLIKKTQDEFNRFIRNRDQYRGCISCGSRVEQAGHFYSAGQYTALRFNEDNCHGQCLQDNYFKHGHLIPYRINLIQRIGEQRVLLLDSAATRNRVHKWNRVELEIIYKKYFELNKVTN